jgi:hypothetical protein
VAHGRDRVEVRRPGLAAALPRPAARPLAEARHDAASAWTGVPDPFAAPAGMPPAAAALPQLDVRRLTDQVARELDRRIAAHRERMGRPR